MFKEESYHKSTPTSSKEEPLNGKDSKEGREEEGKEVEEETKINREPKVIEIYVDKIFSSLCLNKYTLTA